MKYFACLLICIVCFTTYGRQTKSAPVITQFITMTGKIDKYPATMLLCRINDKFSGSYYYHSSAMPIGISGSMDKDRFLKLVYAGGEGTSQEIFEGVFKDSAFSGTWLHQGKMLSFRFTVNRDPRLPAFDYIWTSGSKKITNKQVEYGPDEFTYEAATIWPAGQSKHPANYLIKELIRETFGQKNSSEEIGAIMLSEKKEMLHQDPESEDFNYFTLNRAIEIQYLDAHLLCFSTSTSTYAGGLHGMFGTSYTCIDLVQNRVLSLADVVDTISANPVIEKLLDREFVRKNHAKKEEKLDEYLLVDKIPVNNNFMVTTKGIWFNYVPYEIAPYAEGEILLYIPFKEIAQYLQPGFKKLIGQ
jgi:hypothetical protein